MDSGKFENSPTVEQVGQCGICFIRVPLNEIQNHFLQTHVDNIEENDVLCSRGEQQLHWNPESVLLLIRLVEKYQKEFDTNIKKNVWIKIAKEMSSMTNQNISHDQLDSKWKGLKKTYKNVKDHNKKTGNTPKKWQFFNAMDAFMANKPEVEPVATCSSGSSEVSINKDSETDEDSSSQIRKLQNKRKSTGEIRHKEKMARYDKFLKLFQISVENKLGKKLEDSTDEDD